MKLTTLIRTIGRLAAAVGILTILLLQGAGIAAADDVSLNMAVSFESVNQPGHYIRHRNFVGELTRVNRDLDRADATFILRPGLSGTPNAVSFEAVNHPGHFLHHEGYRIKLSRDDGSTLFRQNGSFIVRPGLSGTPGTVSFEAVNFPGHFIRHQNFELWLANKDAGNTTQFPQDVSFRERRDLRASAPAAGTPPTGPGTSSAFGPVLAFGEENGVALFTASFESANRPDHYIRHRDFLGGLASVGTDLDRADATFILRSSLSGTRGAISFEAVNQRGHFLRHQGFRIELARDDGSEQFRLDASFVRRNALNGEGGQEMVSFEAVSVPNHFIRHQNLELWLARQDAGNTALFPGDVTFRQGYGLHVTPAQCMSWFRRWRAGGLVQLEDAHLQQSCMRVMGIEQFCTDRDAYVVVEYDTAGRRSHFKCQANSHDLTFSEELERLVTGIGQGLATAYTAAAPFLGPVASGVACVNGVIYACAALALDILDQAGVPLTGVAADAVQIATQTPQCVNGNIAACAQIGARGARLAGVNIPGADAAKVAEDAQKCKTNDFAACVRLGRAAGNAAGVPVGLAPPALADAEDCLGGNNQACAALGREAARAGIPLGGLAEGAGNTAQMCAAGNSNACIQLGKMLAEAAH